MEVDPSCLSKDGSRACVERVDGGQPYLPDPMLDHSRYQEGVESKLQNIEDGLLRSLYWGPKQLVKVWQCYFVNGFNFHTKDHNVGKLIMNYGVCVKSSSYRDTDNDFYGMLKEIIELDYPLNGDLHVVLFKCRWVDPTRGMKSMSIYTEYPSMMRDKGWLFARRRLDESWMDRVGLMCGISGRGKNYPILRLIQTIKPMTYTIQMVYNLLSISLQLCNTESETSRPGKDDEDSFDDYEIDDESEERDNNLD
ncbi:UNVERIFIED_CONTAM: hypothetical protein Slati_1936200 [Sesamum latifolium]|uniref:DUF4216 domain-containing protein n=1 Tax=Sesamum latifolium TaxID=2727402 RepID=A0AAW2X2P1_9LAMI